MGLLLFPWMDSYGRRPGKGGQSPSPGEVGHGDERFGAVVAVDAAGQ
jgi:hypothetical protein